MIIAIILLSVIIVVLGIKYINKHIALLIYISACVNKGYDITNEELDEAKSYVIKNIVKDITNKN